MKRKPRRRPGGVTAKESIAKCSNSEVHSRDKPKRKANKQRTASASIVRAYMRHLEGEPALLRDLLHVPDDVVKAAFKTIGEKVYTGYWLVHERNSLGGSPAVICRTKRGKVPVLRALKRLEKRNLE